jgi:hypothetical protein
VSLDAGAAVGYLVRLWGGRSEVKGATAHGSLGGFCDVVAVEILAVPKTPT